MALRQAFLWSRRGLVVGGVAVGFAGTVASTEESSSVPPKKPGIYQSAGFDPKAIEDVADMLRNHSRSEMARMKAEAVEAQKEEVNKKAQYVAAAREAAGEARNARNRETQATRQEQRRHEEARSRYKAGLAHERETAATRLDEALKAGEEDLRVEHEQRLEAMRRDSVEFEAKLRHESDAKFAAAKATWTARAQRETQDLRLAMLRAKGAAARDSALEAVRTSLTTMGIGITDLLADRNKAMALAAVIAGLTLGVSAARHATRIAENFVSARLKKPSLVRETSRGYALSSVAGRAATSLAAPREPPSNVAAAALAGAAFAPALEDSLGRFATSATNMRKHKAPFRHALLHGPPGTGKTMFAKQLAKSVGMDYAILSGGDVAPLGREAVTEIHKLFDWAKTSPRGLLLLVDEADAFVRSRKTPMSEDARNALNAFLYRTGSPSTDILVVFATNAPELFDEAVLDRVDEVINFDKPAVEERVKILNAGLHAFARHSDDVEEASPTWWQRLFGVATPPRRVALVGVTIDHVQKAARNVDGFSGREVSKLAIAWGAAAFGSSPSDPVLTPDLLASVTRTQIDATNQKRVWYDQGAGFDRSDALVPPGRLAS